MALVSVVIVVVIIVVVAAATVIAARKKQKSLPLFSLSPPLLPFFFIFFFLLLFFCFFFSFFFFFFFSEHTPVLICEIARKKKPFLERTPVHRRALKRPPTQTTVFAEQVARAVRVVLVRPPPNFMRRTTSFIHPHPRRCTSCVVPCVVLV